MIKYFERNTTGTDYCVGDIHFAFRKLQAQLDEMGFDPTKDRLFCPGDLVDRGDDVDLLETWLDYDWLHASMGNHEHMIISHMKSNSIRNGGAWFYNLPEVDQLRVYDKLAALPLAMEVKVENGTVGFVHADPVTLDWNEFKENPNEFEAVWYRDRIHYSLTDPVANIDLVYVGHTPTPPKMLGNVIYIDNGAWAAKDRPFNIQRI